MKRKRANNAKKKEDQSASFAVGQVVWAKLSTSPYWPAIICDSSDFGERSDTKTAYNWVFWFGDETVSQIANCKICPFKENFARHFSKSTTKTFRISVFAAIKNYLENCYMRQMVSNTALTEDFLLQWAKQGFLYDMDYKPEIPGHIADKLRQITNDLSAGEEDPNALCQQRDVNKKSNCYFNLGKVCLACYGANITDQHPIFVGSICSKCKKRLMTTLYVFGSDNIHYFCTICANRGQMIVCSDVVCGRVYCETCIEQLEAGRLAKIRVQHKWLCYLCRSYAKYSKLEVRKNWRDRLRVFEFIDDCSTLTFPAESVGKQTLNVLSLFDGIATGLYVLKQKLGLKVGHYYACEIDGDASGVARRHFGALVEHLGDVRQLTLAQIASLDKVHLVIGGSPCQDFSLANPQRRGLYDFTGSGVLFFEFFRILQLVRSTFGPDVFWLYENVASMSKATRQDITRYLACEGVTVDAAWFSPQRRARHFWGNVPGLLGLPRHAHRLEAPRPLQDCLDRNASRLAAIDCIATVTTQAGSLVQAGGSIMPVQAGGHGERLSTTELERVFGFPANYTQLSAAATDDHQEQQRYLQLSRNRRQRLLGNSWSVPVLTAALKSLTDYFSTTTT